MKDILLTILRNKETTQGEFRLVTDRLAAILAGEAGELLQKKQIPCLTPVGEAKGCSLKNSLILLPILRSGLALLPPFMFYFDQAKIGFLGMRRDELTAKPYQYYQQLPDIHEDDDVIILDPMIATGGTCTAAIAALRQAGVRDEKILTVSIMASNEGAKFVKSFAPKVRSIVAAIDPLLNPKKYIVPGLGDFGDRYFGTNHS